MLRKLALFMIGRAERRLGVKFDYVRHMAETDCGLLNRYNRLFGMIDPRSHVSSEIYHAARIRAALAADCGTCVEVEYNLGHNSGVSDNLLRDILKGSTTDQTVQAAIDLAHAVVRDRTDHPEARDVIRAACGETGLIELCLAMNGAAMLPGIKRGMGYATACDMTLMRRLGGA